jgi:hypothetical protein
VFELRADGKDVTFPQQSFVPRCAPGTVHLAFADGTWSASGCDTQRPTG